MLVMVGWRRDGKLVMSTKGNGCDLNTGVNQ